ncbi:MAG: hypothetical protein M9962_11590 [Oligoflexia bacterium]|nr:hypothetical protein [Oligoflexia bacterium]
MNKIINLVLFLSVSLLFSATALAGSLISIGVDAGDYERNRYIGEESVATLDAMKKLTDSCLLIGGTVSNLNVHYGSCYWGRAGELKTCKVLASANCSASANNIVVLNKTANLPLTGDIDEAMFSVDQVTKKLSKDACLALNGSVKKSLEVSGCDGNNANDDMICRGSSIVQCEISAF